ncbi:MAG: hypothetical protein JWN04_5615 [Myxococcaceae bacterium]|nr:hypothetical protein [Myxococcaceae bacterium]
MNSQYPVVVYAASGYTGRLVCEALTKLRIPFLAAGRNLAKLEEVARELRAQGADCSARAAEHTPAALRSLFQGARVVINTSGPFSLLGHDCVEAALAVGAHYVDTTGEQDFMFDLRRDYHERFKQANLLLSPSAAFLWAPGAAAAELCLDVHGIDSLSIAYAPPSLQTVASLQSMFRSARRASFGIVQGRLTPLPPDLVHDVVLPSGEVRRGLLLGSGETTFLQGDPRLQNLDTTFTSNDLAKVAPIFGLWNRISKVVDGDVLDKLSDRVVPMLKKDPPAEDAATQAFVVQVKGTGHGKSVRVIVTGHSPYVSTGFLCAMGAQSVLDGKAQRLGYASLAQAFGAKYVFARLEEIGTKYTLQTAGEKLETKRARSATA